MKHGFTSWLLWQVFGIFPAAYRYISGSLLVGFQNVFPHLLFDFLDCLMAARWPLCLRALNINAL